MIQTRIDKTSSRSRDCIKSLQSISEFEINPGFPWGLSPVTLSGVFQVIFNPISAAEMSALPKDLQLDLLAEFQILPDDLASLSGEHFSQIKRDGRTLHRYRCRDHRIYFERHPEGILIHRVLHKNTIRDFLFRSKLPMTDDDQVESTDQFWNLIHTPQLSADHAESAPGKEAV